MPPWPGNGPACERAKSFGLGPRLSSPTRQTRGMKTRFYTRFLDEGEVVASGGQAQLIKFLDGKLELRGGTKEDRMAAREWLSLFWHEAIVREQ